MSSPFASHGGTASRRPRAAPASTSLAWVLAISATALFAAPTVGAAQSSIFSDGFELDDVCGWWFATGDHAYCEQCAGRPEGASCGQQLVVGGCGTCVYTGGTCDESGMQSCTCTTYTCTGGACTSSAVGCAVSCERVTDGDLCGTQSCGGGNVRDLCCGSAGSCSVICSSCYCAICRPGPVDSPREVSLTPASRTPR